MSMKEGENDDRDDGKKPHAHTNDGNGNGDGTKKKKKKKIKKLPPTSNNSEITSASASASASGIQIPSVEATMVPEKLPTASAVVIPSYPTTSFTHTNTNTNTSSSNTATSCNPATIRVMAPDTLYAGSVFEAQVNMNTFMVTVPYGGVIEGDIFDVPYPTSFTNTTSAAANYPVTTDSVQVMAPSTMNEGQMFEAQVNGIEFMVTVPKNGINKGELFTVPYPTYTYPTTATTIGGGESPPLLSTGPTANNTTNVVNAYDIPTTDGRWRTDICDCCPADNCSLCCMGFCCTPCVMAQLIQRMKYNFAGVPVQPNGTGYKNVCMVISIITIIVFITASILSDILPFIGYLLLCGWSLYLIIIFTCARYSMRKEYNINSLCCNNGDAANDDGCGGVEDFCLVYWCSCCSAIQMIAHTHDGKKYPYNPCNQTGLDIYAPDIHIV
ncbi:hypothetical protein FRACYDRAFT_233470 [Fragilariopsis cylindrus CCMP1102]|uniref:PLAC8-domain-containing protein n=1 Tax=Fragilariopsis cylindrus CCMP1102 TaxID=635003 RepID=A0A1E7FYR8_9STRA|nr:hypothetical protein FRACYDRAFT_233470 [Fragilariopsis cylindrus CCMP1102]|eukprot:OEU23297.1 hypothetical protein FRACYDRAFT_233470 [Fragilariopsis cylindrus CCMP1102]